MERFRSVQLANMRLEEREKCQKEINRIQAEVLAFGCFQGTPHIFTMLLKTKMVLKVLLLKVFPHRLLSVDKTQSLEIFC